MPLLYIYAHIYFWPLLLIILGLILLPFSYLSFVVLAFGIVCCFIISGGVIRSVSLVGIIKSLIYQNNHRALKVWGLKVFHQDDIKHWCEIEYVYSDRFKWENKRWEDGEAYYLKIFNLSQDSVNFSAIAEECKKNELQINISNRVTVIGKVEAETYQILTIPIIENLLSILYYDKYTRNYCMITRPSFSGNNSCKRVSDIVTGKISLSDAELEIKKFCPNEFMKLGKLS